MISKFIWAVERGRDLKGTALAWPNLWTMPYTVMENITQWDVFCFYITIIIFNKVKIRKPTQKTVIDIQTKDNGGLGQGGGDGDGAGHPCAD